jgi:hypothetical protein
MTDDQVPLPVIRTIDVHEEAQEGHRIRPAADGHQQPRVPGKALTLALAVQSLVELLNKATGTGHNSSMRNAGSHGLHPNRTRGRSEVRWGWVVLGAALAVSAALAEDSVDDLLGGAKPATAPATLTAPTATENRPTADALGTLKPRVPEGSRAGTIVLSNGIKLDGRIWTTAGTPLRVWIEEDKVYRDIDLDLVRRIDVHVLAETMEDDWRWLKEGSDQKVYSGKKYPNVSLAYKFTLLNDQVIEGTIVAAVYCADTDKSRTLALYKSYKGNLDETLKDLVYITSVTLEPGATAAGTQPKRSTKLPLLED